jgi:hypothetical protein
VTHLLTPGPAITAPEKDFAESLWQGVGYDPQMWDSAFQPRSDALMWGAAFPDQRGEKYRYRKRRQSYCYGLQTRFLLRLVSSAHETTAMRLARCTLVFRIFAKQVHNTA